LKSTELSDSLEGKSRRELYALSIASLITLGIIFLSLFQYFGIVDGFPFNVRNKPVSLGETGDFIGGWANSIALTWIITVTYMQYLDLKLQRLEFRKMREEYSKQEFSSEQQAKASLEILELDKRRLVYEQIMTVKSLISSEVLNAAAFINDTAETIKENNRDLANKIIVINAHALTSQKLYLRVSQSITAITLNIGDIPIKHLEILEDYLSNIEKLLHDVLETADKLGLGDIAKSIMLDFHLSRLGGVAGDFLEKLSRAGKAQG
jgi:hypothetical protein